MKGRGWKLTKLWGGFSEKGEKIVSLAEFKNKKNSTQQKNGFESMSPEEIQKKIEHDTAIFLKSGGKITTIPEGESTSETSFQDKH